MLEKKPCMKTVFLHESSSCYFYWLWRRTRLWVFFRFFHISNYNKKCQNIFGTCVIWHRVCTTHGEGSREGVAVNMGSYITIQSQALWRGVSLPSSPPLSHVWFVLYGGCLVINNHLTHLCSLPNCCNGTRAVTSPLFSTSRKMN